MQGLGVFCPIYRKALYNQVIHFKLNIYIYVDMSAAQALSVDISLIHGFRATDFQMSMNFLDSLGIVHQWRGGRGGRGGRGAGGHVPPPAT